MQEHANQYLDRALEPEAKAGQAEDPLMKKTYEELARSYRWQLTLPRPRCKSRPPAAFADVGVLS
jgi:hypothetical protein